MKLKFVSDGTLEGTKIVNSETGELLDGVYEINYEASSNREHELTIKLFISDVDINVDDFKLAVSHDLLSQIKSNKAYRYPKIDISENNVAAVKLKGSVSDLYIDILKLDEKDNRTIHKKIK